MSLVVLAAFVLLFVSGDAEGAYACPDLDFEAEMREDVNPVSLLEERQYVFNGAEPRSKSCLRKRVCQVNKFTRERFGQSYYVSLKTRGGAELERQFPEVVRSIVEARGERRMIYLNNFCRRVEKSEKASS